MKAVPVRTRPGVKARRQLRGGRTVQEPQGPGAAVGLRRRGLDAARAAQRDRHRAGLVLAGRQQPDLAGRPDRREGQRDPGRRRLGRAVHADHRALALARRRVLREQGRHVRVRADAQHQHVEAGDRSVVLGARGPGELRRVRRRRRVHVRPVRTVGGGHHVHARRIHRDGVQQRLAGLRVVALGVVGGDVALVAPPEVQPRPVDRVPGGRRGEGREQPVAVAAAGQDHRRGAAGRLRVHDLRDQPGRRGLRHQLLVPVDDDLGSRHTHVLPPCR